MSQGTLLFYAVSYDWSQGAENNNPNVSHRLRCVRVVYLLCVLLLHHSYGEYGHHYITLLSSYARQSYIHYVKKYNFGVWEHARIRMYSSNKSVNIEYMRE